MPRLSRLCGTVARSLCFRRNGCPTPRPWPRFFVTETLSPRGSEIAFRFRERMFDMCRRILIACCFLLFTTAVFGSDWDKRTVITIAEPVIVAGNPVVTLEPGKYVML